MNNTKVGRFEEAVAKAEKAKIVFMKALGMNKSLSKHHLKKLHERSE